MADLQSFEAPNTRFANDLDPSLLFDKQSKYTHSATFITSYYHTDKLERLDSTKAPKNILSCVDPLAKNGLLGNLKIVQSKAHYHYCL